MEIERRQITGGLQIEERADGKKGITGLGIVFNKRSVNMGGFVEIVLPEAVRGIDFSDPDIVSAINHDINQVVGRAPDTLEIDVRNDGVYYFIPESDDPDYRSLESKVKRGIIRGSSFSFNTSPGGDKWTDEDGGNYMLRTISEFSGIYDLSPVVRPAYPDTTVAKRSMDEWKEKNQKKDNEKSGYPIGLAERKHKFLKSKY